MRFPVTQRILTSVFIFGFSVCIFIPSLKNDFVWDDTEVIEKSYYSFNPHRILSVVVPKETQTKRARYYRPMFYISVVLDRYLWGITPYGFHLSNIIFHSTATVLLYLMILMLLSEFGTEKKEQIALFSSLLFAVHPMHVESVSWIAGRTDIICGLFLFLAFIFHMISYKVYLATLLSAFSFFLSLLSKEVAIVFPLITLSFDLLNLKLKDRRNILKYSIYLSTVFIYLYLRGRAFITVPGSSLINLSETAKESLGIWEIIRTLLNSYFIYINKLVFPFSFNAFIGEVPANPYYTASSLFVLLTISVISFILLIRGEKSFFFNILWIIITLAPSLLVAIFKIASTPIAERYLYIPSAGYCILLASAILNPRLRNQRLSILILVLICLVFLPFNIKRQGVWEDNLSLWEDTSKKSFHHALPHTNYALALMKANREEEAIREFTIALTPDIKDTNRGRAITLNNLGILYIKREDYTSAERVFLKALNLDPSYGRTYYHLGLIYFIKGEYGDASGYITAERYLKQTLSIYKNYGRAHLLLAKVYLRRGEKEKAMEQARIAIRSGLSEPLVKEAQDILQVDN
ncbi:hypothetical protein HRbin37_00624 [bacterium HR37]|nr:hypothetical protein HRbin37_00624 [bacterium HR37]